VVPQAGRAEVRWIQASVIPGSAEDSPEVETLIVQMARENSGWGYDRIAGALANLGHSISDQTVGNVLRRYGIAPAPRRSQTTTWKDFIDAHMTVLAGMDFFTAEVLTWRGLVTYYVLFVIQLETRRVTLAGVTPIRRRRGSSRWVATSPMWNAALSAASDTYSMTATRSPVADSEASCATAA
jgi:hypothetical protein